MPLGINGARLLFQVVSACYEKRSVVFTTNIDFSKWGTILGDDKLASAMIAGWFTMEGSSSSTARARGWTRP